MLFLSELLKGQIRKAIQQFIVNRTQTKALIYYFNTMVQSYNESREKALDCIKMLPERNQGSVNEDTLIIIRLAGFMQQVEDKSLRL